MNTHFDDRDGDPLADLLGSATTGQPRVSTAPASYTAPNFEEKCRKCGGSGQFIRGRFSGPCFACKGSGKLTFKTSTDTRNRASVARTERKARDSMTVRTEFAAAHPDVWQWMDGSTYPFAVSLMNGLLQYGSLTSGQLDAARKCIAKIGAAKAASAERTANAPVITMDKIEAAFATARSNGLSRIKARFAGLTFQPAAANTANAGSIYVREGETYLGKIKGGRFIGSRDCTPDHQKMVCEVAADPRGAAIAYGRKTGSCCCCGRELTDPVSVEMGIGPICAEKWGW